MGEVYVDGFCEEKHYANDADDDHKVDDHGVNVDEQQECELLFLRQLACAGREGGLWNADDQWSASRELSTF